MHAHENAPCTPTNPCIWTNKHESVVGLSYGQVSIAPYK